MKFLDRILSFFRRKDKKRYYPSTKNASATWISQPKKETGKFSILLEDGEKIVSHPGFLLSVYRNGMRFNMVAEGVRPGDEIGFVDQNENVFKFKVTASGWESQ